MDKEVKELDLLEDEKMSLKSRIELLEEMTASWKSEDFFHYKLIELLYSKEEEMAIAVAKAFCECDNFDDFEVYEDIVYGIYNHPSNEVSRILAKAFDGMMEMVDSDGHLGECTKDGRFDKKGYRGRADEAADILPMFSKLANSPKSYDVFISFASEQRREIVNPMMKVLKTLDVNYWYDSGEIKTGDEIRKRLFTGLRNTKFAIVVFSKEYLKKYWTSIEFEEIRTLFRTGNLKIIPLLYKVSFGEVEKFWKDIKYYKCVVVDEGSVEDITTIVYEWMLENGLF